MEYRQTMDKLTNQYIIEILESKFAQNVEILGEPYDLLTIAISPSHIIELLTYLKEEESLRFNYLTDITAVHYPKQEKSFAVVYHLHNLFQNFRIRIKVFLEGDRPAIPTATGIWKGAKDFSCFG